MRKRRAPGAAMTMLALVTIGGARSALAQESEVVALTPGQVLEREMPRPETHRYSVELRAGDYLQVMVEQNGADVVQTLTAPDGTVVLRTETPAGPLGPNLLATVVPTAGTYALALKRIGWAWPPKRYRIRLEAVREPGPGDLLRARTVQANSDAAGAFRKEPAVGLARYGEALAGWEALGDREMQLWTRQMMGYLHSQGFDQYHEAEDQYRRALALALELRNEYAEARLWQNLAATMRRLGRLEEAKVGFEHALSLHRAAGRDVEAGKALLGLGTVMANLGELQDGLDHLHDALHTFEAGDVPRGQAAARMDMGRIHLQLGDHDLALDDFQAALPALTNEPHTRAECITQIGLSRLQLGDLDGARQSYTEALGIYKKLENRILEADTYRSLGELRQQEGDLVSARDLFASALAVYEARGYPLGEGLAQCRMGEVQRRLGDLAAARTAFETALATAPRASAFVGVCAQAGLARVARDVGDLDAAQVQAESALARAELLRADVASHRMRTALLAANQNVYELLIDVLMRKREARPDAGYDAAAFDVAERGRARSLLELLSDSGVDLRRGVPPELVAEERSLSGRLNAMAADQAQALAGGRAERAAALDRDLDSLSAQLTEIESRIRRASPQSVAAMLAEPLGLAEIRRRVIDPDTQLLEYALGEDRSYLWVASARRLDAFRLPPRAEIEAAARRLHELIAAGPSVHRADRGRAALDMARRELSRLILAPAAAALTARRLVVVAPDALQYVPIGSLPLAGDVLLARFEVVSAPSASVLAKLRDDARGRARGRQLVAVFADPVFDPSDPRLARARRRRLDAPSVQMASRGAASGEEGEAALRALRGRGPGGALARLPFSRQEADAIASMAPGRQSLRATGFAANREAATSAQLADYRIVHFATHGVLNTRRPELSGVVLSLFDVQGRKRDGFLRLHDIYNMSLAADLVVLSGCQTALGKDLKGEGLIGLTRGFMHAGARAVVASLWQVDDESTSELMRRFYREILKGGRRPADALRAAQLELRRDQRWSAPFYWAGFVLQGDWK